MNEFVIALIFILGISSIVGIFCVFPDKNKFLSLLYASIIIIAALLLGSGKIESSLFVNIILVIVGFAGGLGASIREKDEYTPNQR